MRPTASSVQRSARAKNALRATSALRARDREASGGVGGFTDIALSFERV